MFLVWDDLGKKFADSDVVVGKIDATVNEVQLEAQ